MDEYKCQPKILHIVPEAVLERTSVCRRRGSPKCLRELSKRKGVDADCMDITENALPGPQGAGFTWTNLPHDVPKRSNDSITSSFPPTGTLHYVAKKEILHRSRPIWLAEHHRLQTSFPAHSTNPLTSRSHTEALTSSGDLPASVLRKACILPGACKMWAMFTSMVWEVKWKGSYCMKNASTALLPPFLLDDTRQLN